MSDLTTDDHHAEIVSSHSSMAVGPLTWSKYCWSGSYVYSHYVQFWVTAG